MLAQLIAVGIALLLAVVVSASDVQEMAPPPEAIDGLKRFSGEGFEDVSEIINGFRVPNARFPYYTYLVMYDGSWPVSSCGGTLIHDDIVLTAAQCLYNSGKPWTRIVAFGALKDGFHPRNPFNPSTGQWRDVVVRYTAPDYKIRKPRLPDFEPRLMRNDIALFKLAGPIRGVVKPKLNYNSSIPATGRDMIVVGYGRSEHVGLPATTLMGVNITNQAPNVCAAHLPSYYLQDIMICANKGACHGDTGGPLILPHSHDASGDLQIGFLTFRHGTCTHQICSDGYDKCTNNTSLQPDAYTRVSTYYDLILSFICLKSSYRHTYKHPYNKSLSVCPLLVQ